MNANSTSTPIDDDEIVPFIPPSQSLPEITIKAIILSIILTGVLAAANTYLGLKVGMTVTGSIPAAIISMAILRFFRQHNILENNIVQTAASAGEALAAGALFTLPALIIVRYWLEFDYWSSVAIILTGGILGVLFSIPLRRTFIHDRTLKFPEGMAIGNVLKMSASTGGHIKQMVYGALIGGLISLCQNALRLLASSASYWTSSFGTVVGFGTGFDAAVLGAGYIVGAGVGISILFGAVCGWGIGIPLLGHFYDIPDFATSSETADFIYKNHLRFVGVGTMLVGGLYAIFSLAKPIMKGIGSSIDALSTRRAEGHGAIPRTERDIPINYVFWGILVCAIAMGYIFYHFVGGDTLGLSSTLKWSIIGINVVYMILAGFAFSAICGYLAGLVGSSSSPISGILLAAVLLACLFLLPLLSIEVQFLGAVDKVSAGIAIAIVMTALCSSAAVIANDNLQDLKAGQVVGATPWKQQVMLIFGVVVSAFLIPPIMELLFNAYGIGGTYPVGSDPANFNPELMLAAPQSALLASIAEGVFGNNLPWGTIGIGAIFGVVCIIIDELIKPKGYRLPVLAVGLGIYLPFSASIPITLGGLLSYFVHRKLLKNDAKAGRESHSDVYHHAHQKGVTIACGLVAGASIVGILLAIPAVYFQDSNALRIVPENFGNTAEILSVIVTAGLFYWIYQTVKKDT